MRTRGSMYNYDTGEMELRESAPRTAEEMLPYMKPGPVRASFIIYVQHAGLNPLEASIAATDPNSEYAKRGKANLRTAQ